MKYYKLDKIFVANTDYRAEDDKLYVITKIGTDLSDVKPTVAGQKIGALSSDFAPLHKTSSNLLGPFDLKDLYIVVPPRKVLKFESSSSGKVRAIGKILELAPGEGIPNDLIARFEAHGKNYYTYSVESVSLGTDVALTADQEVEILSLKPTTIEKYVFDNIVMLSVSGGSFSEGDLALRIYVDDKPLDILESAMGKKGIDALSLPYPPSDSTEEIPFTLSDMPIEIPGDHTITFKVVNTSGGSLAPASGSSWTFKLLVVYRRYQVA